ncbi:CDP-alcohol phosphatidyltransferase family protein [Thermophilibacter provencensis]|uniref:CDP-alcohol phosphatidyltransferase family protein n=1 Tax=Thermophilibacter provencensis TaxID=1852386 RepID=A0ABT7V314_9ACTN|nr:CDP-alcohol phosphatidyltransferase family protein [Thermophilibacter provencensis]MDM8270995.1 CDP-alcohol phosphatidyltransferase family protein [Thermophilibacter provencensis]
MSERTERTKSLIKSIADADAAERQASGRSDIPVGTSGNPSTQVLTVANVITFCRLALTIVFLFLFATGSNRAAALVCYVVAAATDFLDGQVARRTQTVSWLGKIMDPIMDRVLLFTGVLGLLIVGELPLWVPVFVIGRDVYLAVGGLILQRYRRRPIDVAYVGKAATALLMFGFCDLLLGLPVIPGLGLVDAVWLPGLNDQASALGILFVYAGVICSLITAVVYTAEGVRIVRSRHDGEDGAK